MSAPYDIIKDYDKSIVKVTTHNGLNVGTGFIVTNDGINDNCYHIIGDLTTKEIYEDFNIYYPLTKQTVYATLIIESEKKYKEKYTDSINDIAFLQISKADQNILKERGEELISLPLSETIKNGHQFISRGFRKDDEFPDGLGSKGEIRVLTTYRIDTNREIPIFQLYAEDIQEGMSGRPVIDMVTNGIIGMIDRIYDKDDLIDPNLVMAIPVKSIINVYTELKQKNDGLKILEFLKKANVPNTIWFQKIDDLYVPPMEYNEIIECLEKNKIVFITGPAEYGKTYSAINILNEYYKKGYDPKYIYTRNEHEKATIREKLYTIESLLPHSIIFLEEPFGT